jgi:hypothetical protein
MQVGRRTALLYWLRLRREKLAWRCRQWRAGERAIAVDRRAVAVHVVRPPAEEVARRGRAHVHDLT